MINLIPDKIRNESVSFEAERSFRTRYRLFYLSDEELREQALLIGLLTESWERLSEMPCDLSIKVVYHEGLALLEGYLLPYTANSFLASRNISQRNCFLGWRFKRLYPLSVLIFSMRQTCYGLTYLDEGR